MVASLFDLLLRHDKMESVLSFGGFVGIATTTHVLLCFLPKFILHFPRGGGRKKGDSMGHGDARSTSYEGEFVHP